MAATQLSSVVHRSIPRVAQRPGVTGATVFLFAITVASIGLSWDIQWHIWVGRDTFWSPPHLLLYSGVALFGVTSIGQTWASGVQRRERPATGYLLGAAGAAILLIAAPFDDLWHRLYGIDVDLWTPAHLAGLVGGAIAGAGVALLWAQLQRERQPGRPWGVYGLAALFAASGLLQHFLTMAQPAFNRYPTADAGDLRIMLLPVLQAAALAATLVGAGRALGWPAAPLVVGALLWARQALLGVAVPALVGAGVAAGGLSYRWADGMPPVTAGSLLAGGFYLPAALAVAVSLWLGGTRFTVRAAVLSGIAIAIIQVLLAQAFAESAARSLDVIARLAPEVVGRAGAGVEAARTARGAAFPVALAAAIGSALVGNRLARAR